MTITQCQSKLLRFTVVLLMFAVILVSTSCVSQDKYNSLQTELTSTQGHLEYAQSQLENARLQLQNAQSQLTQLQDELSSTQDQVSSLNQQITTLQSQLNLYKASGIIVQSGVQPNYSLGLLGEPVNLISNLNAKNPTWQQLVTFINADKTDGMIYFSGFKMCGAFAEDVYNNAEAAGIRAAWVAVNFSDGSTDHALNAFLTTDKGLVYIDCTGGDIDSIQICVIGEDCPYSASHDKVAYVQVGKELGLISLNSNVPLTYQGYENEKNKFDSYTSDVESYNKYIAGKVFIIGTPEDNYVEAWYQRLKQEESTLQDAWQPLGIVSSVEIYW